jgi:hypothetical protein
MTDPTLLDDTMREEYDFSRAKRGNPYLNRLSHKATIETEGGDRTVQIKTIELTAIVSPEGTTTLQLPADITPGRHRITLLIQEEQ